MPATKLTDNFCKSVKGEPGTQRGYPDAQVTGLEFRVSGEGRKSWSLRYRTLDGRQQRLTLGTYPVLGLAEARTEALEKLADVRRGGDPAAEKRIAKGQARAEPIKTVHDLWTLYVRACERGEWRPKGRAKRAVSIANDRNIYRLYVEPTFGKVRLEEVTRASVKAALRALVDRGLTSRVNRAHALLRQMLSYAVAEERLPFNPIAGLKEMIEEKPRQRILNDGELQVVWKGILDPGALRLPPALAEGRRDGDRVFVGPAVSIALRLTLLLLQRRQEVSGMAVAELDLDHAVWLIPPERMKNHRPHAVPLPPEALALIQQALRFNDRGDSPYVFPSPRDKNKPIGPAALTHALSGVYLATGVKDATVHDLRRTGSTLLTSERLGISPFIRSKVLGHYDSGGGSAVSAQVYDWNSYMAEKRAALTAWENLLLQVVGEREAPDNVSQLRPAVARP